MRRVFSASDTRRPGLIAHHRHTEDFQRPYRSRVAIFKPEFLKDPRKVHFDRIFSTAQNSRDFGIRLALSHPEQNFGFPRRKAGIPAADQSRLFRWGVDYPHYC